MAQLTKQDWLQAGLKVLATNGAPGLTIEALTQHLQVTKGSFYHHFDGFGDFKTSLLTYFEEVGTLDIIEMTEKTTAPEARLRRLLEIIVQHTPPAGSRVEVAVRAWALQDEAAAAVQARIDAQRIAYVQSLCQPILGNRDQALLMAQMLYALLVGSEQIQPPLSREQLQALFDQFLQLNNLA